MYLEIWLSVYLYLYDNVHTLLQLFFCVTKYKMEDAGEQIFQDDSNENGDSSGGERVSDEHTETDNNQESESDFAEETDPSTNLSNVLGEVDMLSDGVSDDNVDSENLEALNSSADEKDPLPFSDEDLDILTNLEDDADDGYGGRGEPELQETNLIEGDILEFCNDGVIYTGLVIKVEADFVKIKHLDSKRFQKTFTYNKFSMGVAPNWFTLQHELRSEMIRSFDQFKLLQTISFCGIETNSEGESIVRRGIIRRIFKRKGVKKNLLYRQSGPSKYDNEEDDILEYDLTFAELGDKEEIWDWHVMNNIWEIIVPPPIEIRNGGINWSCEKKEILETPFTGPPPGFKPGMDLGLGADDFAWIKQIITEKHVEKYWLENSNKEGERLKLAAEERYRQTKRENMELFGIAHGKDSKWRRYRSLTL